MSALVAVAPTWQAPRIIVFGHSHHSDGLYQLHKWGTSSSITGNPDHTHGVLLPMVSLFHVLNNMALGSVNDAI